MKRDKLACYCNHVSYGMIEDAIKGGATSYEEVQGLLNFGKGCSKCTEFIKYMIKDMLDEQKSSDN